METMSMVTWSWRWQVERISAHTELLHRRRPKDCIRNLDVFESIRRLNGRKTRKYSVRLYAWMCQTCTKPTKSNGLFANRTALISCGLHPATLLSSIQRKGLVYVDSPMEHMSTNTKHADYHDMWQMSLSQPGATILCHWTLRIWHPWFISKPVDHDF